MKNIHYFYKCILSPIEKVTKCIWSHVQTLEAEQSSDYTSEHIMTIKLQP